MKSIALLLAAAFLFTPAAARAGETVSYKDGNVELEGYWVPSACPARRNVGSPVILVVHQWRGLGENEKHRAEMLSKECYDAFAIDMYGKGIRPANNEDAGKQATIYKSDSALARRRLKAALDYALSRDGIDKSKIAVIGYCFGGTMALELARSGADIKGAVSFHGGLGTGQPATSPGVIKASIQVHHGADDPMVPPAEVDGFIREMNAGDADWSLTQYAHAVHAFTQIEAGNDPSTGVAYNEKADKRSWAATLAFLREIFEKN